MFHGEFEYVDIIAQDEAKTKKAISVPLNKNAVVALGPVYIRHIVSCYADFVARHVATICSHNAKQDVRVYDYVDSNIAMLMRVYEKRLKKYRAIGCSIE